MEGRSQTVAVVDDDSSMRRSIQRLLNAHGLLAEGFPSAEAFLSRVSGSPVACVVLDIHLPGMSGLELQRRLMEASPQLPVILITGKSDDATRKESFRFGCVAYLLKPFAPESLIAAVWNAISGLPSG